MLTIYGEHEEKTLEQMNNCLTIVPDSLGVMCADGHLGYAQPVGGVVAYKNHISISGVGFDIACGNMAVKTDMNADSINIEEVMDRIFSEISFGIGRNNEQKLDWDLIDTEYHDLFDRMDWRNVGCEKQKAVNQLGTIGSGNHYIDIFKDDDNIIWVGVHFGSRGLGHTTATMHLKRNGGVDGMMVDPCLVEIGTKEADDYIKAMEWCGEYAYAGRQWASRYVAKSILGANIVDEIHNHHNFAWKENHFGEDYWVIRKGATPAFPKQRGFVGGSMGDDAVIIEGVDSEESKNALYSTVHGAGRVMSRTQARGKYKHNKETGETVCKQEPQVDRGEMQDWIRDKGVTLRGADLDEAPQAYRRLTDVLECHENTIKILHTLHPIGVAMAGKDTFDPYKD